LGKIYFLVWRMLSITKSRCQIDTFLQTYYLLFVAKKYSKLDLKSVLQIIYLSEKRTRLVWYKNSLSFSLLDWVSQLKIDWVSRLLKALKNNCLKNNGKIRFFEKNVKSYVWTMQISFYVTKCKLSYTWKYINDADSHQFLHKVLKIKRFSLPDTCKWCCSYKTL
jgi:hypothetical protein